MSDPRARDRLRTRAALALFYAGVIGFCVCLLTLGVDGWAFAYACFVAGWIAWMEYSPDSAVNKPRRRDRDDDPQR